MIDLKFLRENPEIVKQNIKNKFQDQKLPLVDEVIELDAKARATQKEADELRASRNTLSKQIGQLMGQGRKDEAEAVKAQVSANAASSIRLFRSEKMTAATWRSKNSANLSFLILKSHITQISWIVLMVSTLTQQEKLQETVSII